MVKVNQNNFKVQSQVHKQLSYSSTQSTIDQLLFQMTQVQVQSPVQVQVLMY